MRVPGCVGSPAAAAADAADAAKDLAVDRFDAWYDDAEGNDMVKKTN